MAEYLNAYGINGHIVKSEERKRLLAEIKSVSEETGDAPFSVDCIHVVLKDSDDRLYVVQRADKPENPFLFDKAIGGHVAVGESHDATMLREAKEELGIEVVLAKTKEEYASLIKDSDLNKMAVVRKVATEFWHKSERLTKEGKIWVKRDNPHVYIGRYNGGVEYVDGEAQDVIRATVEETLSLLGMDPRKFTYDLKEILGKYKNDLLAA